MASHIGTRRHIGTLTGLSAIALVAIAPARAETVPIDAVKDVQACMVRAMQATPGFVDAQVQSLGLSNRDLLLVYRLRASSGQVFNRRVEVYQEGPRNFSIYMIEGLTPALFTAWHSCGIKSVQPPSS